jgi:UTP--glucose-1-phosphate uridylyltransferase
VIEEAVAAGVEEICLVICPGDRQVYAAAAGDHASRLHFVEQTMPRGYGHAVFCAKFFTGSEPFLHLVSDHLPLSRTTARCAQQLVDAATAEACAVSAVQPTRETLLPYFGTVGGRRVPKRADLYEIEEVVEKPTPTEAERTLIVPGLRAGYYLCFFGMHVLTPAVMDILADMEAKAPADSPLQLSPALAALARRERYLAFQVQGLRYDLGMKYGLLLAQLALALDGKDREDILAQLVELMATRERRA